MEYRTEPVAAGPPLLPSLASAWPSVMFAGAVTIAIGIIVLAWPSETLTVLSVLFGIHLLLFGLFRLVSAFSAGTLAPWLAGFIGILSMIAGVVVLRHPFETVAILATVLGVVWIVGGSIDLIAALVDPGVRDRWFVALTSILTIAAGVIVVSWPEPTLQVVAVVAGIYLVVIGAMICLGAFRLRSLEPRPA